MKRLLAALVALVVLVAGLVPADRDAADPLGRVRFDHRRHGGALPDCSFCHRPTDLAAVPPGAAHLDFARPVEAMCLCHPLPENALAPAVGSAAAPSSSAPGVSAEPQAAAVPAPPPASPAAAAPAAPAPAAPEPGPPPIPHTLEAAMDCLKCHAPGGDLIPAPADHADRTNDMCPMCHQPAAAQPPADAPPSSTPPAIPHTLEGRSDCLMCHAPSGGIKPAPADHADRTNDMCPMCHQPVAAPPAGDAAAGGGAAAAPVEAPVIPHITDDLPGCTTCHKPHGLRPIPADHAGRTDDMCPMCHASRGAMQAVPAATGPDPAVCALCHAVDAAGRVAPGALPAPAPHVLDFDHAAHFARTGAACDTCHTPAQADSGLPPPMRTCLTCHADARRTDCARCHLHDARGLLATDLPDGRKLEPSAEWGAAAHLEGWETGHGGAARGDGALCRNCHQQTFCDGCHLGVSTERRFHGAGWITTHGAESRSSDLDCTVCHDEQSTCLSCHRRSGVALSSPDSTVPAGAGRYHPADWVAGPTGHAREARRNLGSCVSCHGQGDCFSCHATVDPHGSSWSDERCEALRTSAAQLCLQCHATLPNCD